MRIGLFTDAYFPIISGVSVSLRTLKAELTKLGHEVFIVTNIHPKSLPEDNIVRIPGRIMPMNGSDDYVISKVTRKKVRQIGELKLDLVHCHTEFTMGRLGRRVARKYNIPMVHTYHTMYEDYCHFISKLFVRPLIFAAKIYSKSFANSADKVIFPTIKVQRKFAEYGYKNESYIVPTGIYLDKFRKINYKPNDIKQKKAELGINEDDFVLLFLGRLSKEKSIEELIIEFAKLLKKNDKLKLLVVGGGPDGDYFNEVCEKLGICDHLVFTGMIAPTEVGLYYQLADLFVNFSVTETQGLTYIEALASGVPLLVKYDHNLEGVIIDDFNGLSFTKDEEFEQKYYELVSNKVKFTEISSNASKAIERFSAEKYATTVLEIYNNLLK